MHRSTGAIRRPFAASLATLLVALSVVMPLLDRGGVHHDIAVESQHSDLTCTPSHDHSVCTHVGHTFSVTAVPAAVDPPRTISGLRLSAMAAASPSPRQLDGPPSRAPPRP